MRLTERDGLLSGLIGQLMEAGLGPELKEHLAAGGQEANGRNGYRAKMLRTEAGPVTLAVPRDRAGTFELALVPRHDRRTSGISDTVVSLYASGGMSVRDILHHLRQVYGTELSAETVSRITDAVLEEVRAWQSLPLDPVYAVLFPGAIMVKVRDNHVVPCTSAAISSSGQRKTLSRSRRLTIPISLPARRGTACRAARRTGWV